MIGESFRDAYTGRDRRYMLAAIGALAVVASIVLGLHP